ncbi:MAG: glycosyltransferase family 39 protein [Candidatus Brocadiia bacterium]
MSEKQSSPLCPALNRAFWAILLMALTVRLLVWTGGVGNPGLFFSPDSADYVRLGENLLETGRYGTEQQPEIFRVPGYPLFLSLTFAISKNPAFVCLLQVVMGVAVCALVWRLAHRLFGRKYAIPAAAFQSVSVVSIVYSCRVLSETLFTLVFLAQLNLLYDIYDSRMSGENAAPATMGGILMGALAYLRAIILPIAFLPVLLLCTRKQWRTAAIFAAATLLTILPWYLRNATRADYLHFSSVGAINLYRYNAAALISRRKKETFGKVQEGIDRELALRETQAQTARYAMRKGRKVILQYPIQYAWLHLKTVPTNLLPAAGDLFRAWGVEIGGSGTLHVLRTRGLLAAIRNYFGGKWGWLVLALPLIILLGVSYVLGLTGAIAGLIRESDRIFIVFLGLLLFYFLVLPGAAAHPRFRVPVAPLISVFAGYGMWCMIEKIRRKRQTDKD